ncbi:MAG: MFS transporter [Chloroflexi bacterium]|nr:MFS transporter [Chloroflexota bacterium]
MKTESSAVGLRSLPKRQVFFTLAGVMLAMFLSSLDQTIVGTAMPRIIADLGGFSHYTWVTTSYLIASTVTIPIVGKLTDMYGRKGFYIAGLVIFVLGSLLSGLSQNMTQIILYRGFQGIGAGVMMANAFTVTGDLFPPAERGKYLGIMSAVFGLSSAVGPTLGGVITDSFSWHWIFFINVPLGIMVIALFIVFFPDFRPAHAQRRIDYLGAAALILAVVPVMLALSWGGVEYPWRSLPIISLFVFSAAMVPLFLVIESKAAEPILPLWIFKEKIVSVSILVTFFTGFAMFGGITFIPLFFQGVLGLSATTSGNFMTPMTLGVVLGSFVSGQVLSRAGGHYRLQGALGMAIVALGTGLFARMTASASYAVAVSDVTMIGFGLGVTLPLYAIAVQNAVPYRVMGAATSATVFFRAIGGSLGLAILGSIMNNRFAAEFIGGLSPAIKTAVPPERLSDLARNPQALVSAGGQSQLQALSGQYGPPDGALFQQLLEALRQALTTALSQLFLISLAVVLIAFVINLFLKEIPLRREHVTEEPATGIPARGKLK